MKTTLIVIAILIVTVTSVHAKKKNNTSTINIYNKTIIQDNRTKSERAIDRANAQVEKNRKQAASSREKNLNRAYAEGEKAQKRMNNDINRILNSSKKP